MKMKKSLMLAICCLTVSASTALAADVYVKERAPMIRLVPGKIYHYNAKPEEIPAPEAPVAPKAAPFTIETIQSAFEDTARAIGQMDASGAITRMTPDAVVHIISMTPQGDVELELSAREYAAYLKSAWSSVDAYSYKIDAMGVVIAKDGQSAMLKAKVSETATVEGKSIVGSGIAIADVRNTTKGPMIARIIMRGATEIDLLGK